MRPSLFIFIALAALASCQRSSGTGKVGIPPQQTTAEPGTDVVTESEYERIIL